MLIVEDDKLISQLIQDYFVNYPYEFIFAEDGEEAYLLSVSKRPDVIITDLMLPKMSGIDLISKLRELPEFAVSPIIAITAGSQELMEQAMNAGAHMVLHKPLSAEQLIKHVDELLMATPFIKK